MRGIHCPEWRQSFSYPIYSRGEEWIPGDVEWGAEVRVIKARETVKRALDSKRVIYGLTTGFGALSDAVISKEQTKQLQGNILMSYAAVVGNFLDEETARATLLLKMNDFAKGHAGMSLEVLLASNVELDKKIHDVRPHPGQIISADNLRRIIQNSEIVSSHKDCSRVQDAYSIRCSPQVHGASIDALHYVRIVIEIEMNAATDNPLIFPETDQIISGGNFHGQPVALALDFLAIALSEIANISHMEQDRILSDNINTMYKLVLEGKILNSVENKIGLLN